VDGVLTLWDGSSTFWSIGGTTDVGTDIESHVLLGPFRPGSAGDFGMLAALNGVVQTDTGGSVTWRIVTGETADEACANAKTALELYLAGDTDDAAEYVSASGTLSNGRSRMFHPRVRAMHVVVWLQSTDQWAYETMMLDIQRFGRWR
jgi:predicted RNase H-like HicB family nuclease